MSAAVFPVGGPNPSAGRRQLDDSSTRQRVVEAFGGVFEAWEPLSQRRLDGSSGARGGCLEPSWDAFELQLITGSISVTFRDAF